MNERRPYRRAMAPFWWARKPYRAYTLRELTGVAVALYALLLLAGVIALGRGPQCYDAYLRFLTGRCSMALHLFLLVAMLWHAVTWFQTLPKTMPKVILSGQVVAQRRLTEGALLVAAICWGLLLALVVGSV
jgi:fumarate reductase subunit C